jgi:hypothetical protein
MVKRMMYIILSALFLSGTSCRIYAEENIYEKDCVPCHKGLPTSLGEMFKSYLLIYSSEKFVKAGLKHYLKNPSRTISVMSNLFIDTYGIKKKTTLPPEKLDQAINIYWEKFKVSNTLK